MCVAAGTALTTPGLSCAMANHSTTTPPQAEARPSPVSEIVFQRACFGCEGAYTATLRADGSATRELHGNARMRVPPRTLKGRVAAASFERLAALLASEGFFELLDSYRNPRLQDGQSITTTAVRSGARKSVLDSNRAGPPQLERIEKAIEAVIEEIQWTPEAQDDQD